MMKKHVVINATINHVNLFVDETYQRKLSDSKIAKMLSEFNESAITSLIVSDRGNGSFAIIDGQHRFYAGVKKGIEQFNCQVYIGLTIAQESELFWLINCNRGVVKNQLQFKALLISGNEKALDIKRIVEQNGFEIKYETNAGASKENELVCVAELLNVYKIGQSHLDLVMKVLRKSWNGSPDSLKFSIIGGLSLFLKMHKENIDVSRLAKILKNTSIKEINEKARKRVELDGGRKQNAICDEIYIQYNRKLKKKLEKKYETVEVHHENVIVESGDLLQ